MDASKITCPPRPFTGLGEEGRAWLGSELAGALERPEHDLSGAAIAAGRLMRGCPGIRAVDMRRLRKWVEQAWSVKAAELVAEASEPGMDEVLDLFRAFAAKNHAVRATWLAERFGPPAAGKLSEGWGWSALLLRDDVESIRVVVALVAGVSGPNSSVVSALTRLDEYVRPIDEAGAVLCGALLPLLPLLPKPLDWMSDLGELESTPWWLATAALVLPVAAPLPADRMVPVVERWHELLLLSKPVPRSG